MNIEAPAVLDTGLALKFLRVLWPAEWFDQYDIPGSLALTPLEQNKKGGKSLRSDWFSPKPGEKNSLGRLLGKYLEHYEREGLPNYFETSLKDLELIAEEQREDYEEKGYHWTPRSLRYKRGAAYHVTALPALRIEIDCKRGEHKIDEDRLPSKAEALLWLRHDCPVAPSVVIDSGGGFHVYWLLDKPLLTPTNRERSKARGIFKGWHELLAGLFKQRGWHLDNVSDLPRVLRLPGTLNCKGPDPLPVAYAPFDDEDWCFPAHRLPLETFTPYEVPATVTRSRGPGRVSIKHTPDKPPPAEYLPLIEALSKVKTTDIRFDNNEHHEPRTMRMVRLAMAGWLLRRGMDPDDAAAIVAHGLWEKARDIDPGYGYSDGIVSVESTVSKLATGKSFAKSYMVRALPPGLFDPIDAALNKTCSSSSLRPVSLSLRGKGRARTLWGRCREESRKKGLRPIAHVGVCGIYPRITWKEWFEDGTLRRKMLAKVNILCRSRACSVCRKMTWDVMRADSLEKWPAFLRLATVKLADNSPAGLSKLRKSIGDKTKKVRKLHDSDYMSLVDPVEGQLHILMDAGEGELADRIEELGHGSCRKVSKETALDEVLYPSYMGLPLLVSELLEQHNGVELVEHNPWCKKSFRAYSLTRSKKGNPLKLSSDSTIEDACKEKAIAAAKPEIVVEDLPDTHWLTYEHGLNEPALPVALSFEKFTPANIHRLAHGEPLQLLPGQMGNLFDAWHRLQVGEPLIAAWIAYRYERLTGENIAQRKSGPAPIIKEDKGHGADRRRYARQESFTRARAALAENVDNLPWLTPPRRE